MIELLQMFGQQLTMLYTILGKPFVLLHHKDRLERESRKMVTLDFLNYFTDTKYVAHLEK